MSLLLDIARESSKFIYETKMTPLLFAVWKTWAFQAKSQSCGIKCRIIPITIINTTEQKPCQSGLLRVAYPSSGTQKGATGLIFCIVIDYMILNIVSKSECPSGYRLRVIPPPSGMKIPGNFQKSKLYHMEEGFCNRAIRGSTTNHF